MVPQAISLLQSPDGLVGGGKVIAGGQSVGVGRAKDPLGINEGTFQERDGLDPAVRHLGRRRRGCRGRSGCRGGLAEDPLAVGEGALVQRDGLAQPPGGLVGGGEVVAGGQGVGVGRRPGPAQRSARVRSYSGMASSSRPAAW